MRTAASPAILPAPILDGHGRPQVDHAKYPAYLRSKDDDALRFIIQDAREAMAAHPDNPKAGYYADEVAYASMELARRQRQGATLTRQIERLARMA